MSKNIFLIGEIIINKRKKLITLKINNKSERNNLLVISHNYADFVKDQIEKLSSHFTNVTVLSRYNLISEIYNILPIHHLKPYRKESLIDLSNKPYNINVIATPIIYIPTDSEYKNIGERHLKIIEKKILNNNIRFDFVHSHFTWSAGYVGAKLKEKYDVPFVVTAHGYDIYDLPFRNEKWREKIEYVLNTADYIITVSNSNLKCIDKLNVKTPVIVIPNGFNNNLFYPRDLIECRKVLDLPFDKKVILAVGSLVEIKGQQYLVDAMREVADRRKDVLCIIVGGGKLETKLKKQIKITGLENNIILVGGRSHSEIPIWMNACDIFVLPSLRESFGVVQIEAMACGKPIVATRNGGSEEIILNEKLGFLVESKNPDELAKKILQSLDKTYDGDYILKYVMKFRIDNIAKDILNIYKKLLVI